MRSWFPPPATFDLQRITAREFRRNNPWIAWLGVREQEPDLHVPLLLAAAAEALFGWLR
jgi:hypothetical protein